MTQETLPIVILKMDFKLDNNLNFTSLLQQGTQIRMQDSDFNKVHVAKEVNSTAKRGMNLDEHEDKLLYQLG